MIFYELFIDCITYVGILHMNRFHPYSLLTLNTGYMTCLWWSTSGSLTLGYLIQKPGWEWRSKGQGY